MPIDYSLFYNPNYGGQGIAHSWISKAETFDRSGHYGQEQFDRLISLWMAFNAWGMCVTLAESDAAMIKALGNDSRANQVFDVVVKRDAGRRDELASIENNFPLPSFADLIRLDPLYNWRGDRTAEYWQKIAEAPRGKRVRVSPRMDHTNLDFGDTLACIYKVRCNLVHGGKMASHDEAQFVRVIANILQALLVQRPINLLDLR